MRLSGSLDVAGEMVWYHLLNTVEFQWHHRLPELQMCIRDRVTIVQFLLQGYVPAVNDALGLYIPLIVVNCIILGRAESFAAKNGPINSFFDGLGMGLGFTVALTILGAFRELLGAGQIFGMQVMPSAYEPITIFILAPGAFFVLACSRCQDKDCD